MAKYAAEPVMPVSTDAAREILGTFRHLYQPRGVDFIAAALGFSASAH